jgi:hypothetical protein
MAMYCRYCNAKIVLVKEIKEKFYRMESVVVEHEHKVGKDGKTIIWKEGKEEGRRLK